MLPGTRGEVRQGVKKNRRLLGHNQAIPVFGMHEAFRDGMAQEFQKAVIETLDVQEPARLLMNPQLRPRHHFKGFLKSTQSTRKGNEGIGEGMAKRFAKRTGKVIYMSYNIPESVEGISLEIEKAIIENIFLKK